MVCPGARLLLGGEDQAPGTLAALLSGGLALAHGVPAPVLYHRGQQLVVHGAKISLCISKWLKKRSK